MSQTVELNVGMSCQGCVGAVRRVLEKMEGVESFDIDKENQKVTVKGNIEPEAVLQTVSKTGKKTSFWEPAQAPAPEPAPAPAQASEPAPAPAPEPAAAPAQAPEPAQAPAPEAESKSTEAVSAVA